MWILITALGFVGVLAVGFEMERKIGTLRYGPALMLFLALTVFGAYGYALSAGGSCCEVISVGC